MSEINGREFGALEKQVENLGAMLTLQAQHAELMRAGMSEEIAALRKEISGMRHTLDEAKGGWRVLMLIGGAAAGIGALVPTVLNHWK